MQGGNERMKSILGRKAGMTQVFTTDGVMVPVTVIEVLPNVVLQKKTVENENFHHSNIVYLLEFSCFNRKERQRRHRREGSDHIHQ